MLSAAAGVLLGVGAVLAAAAGALLGVEAVLLEGTDATAVGAGALQSADVALAASQPMEKAVRFVAAK